LLPCSVIYYFIPGSKFSRTFYLVDGHGTKWDTKLSWLKVFIFLTKSKKQPASVMVLENTQISQKRQHKRQSRESATGILFLLWIVLELVIYFIFVSSPLDIFFFFCVQLKRRSSESATGILFLLWIVLQLVIYFIFISSPLDIFIFSFVCNSKDNRVS